MNPAHSKEQNTENSIKPKDDNVKMIRMVKTKEHPIKVVRLADTVKYQESSIVSKTIIDKKSGTVTVFAFDRGQGLSEHKAPFDALVQILDGEAEITISGKKHPVKTGEVVILPAHEPHSVRAEGRFKMLLTMIKA